MAGAFKRTGPDGKKARKYTGWYYDAAGKQRKVPGFTDKKKTEELANQLELEARRVREGLADPGEKVRREASLRSVKDHVEDYRLNLLSKGDTPDHCKKIANAIRRVLDDAAITSVSEIVPSRVQDALGRLRVIRSARTCNHALGGVKAFATWLQQNNRIAEVPRGLAAIKPFSEAADKRWVRRALTLDELARLLDAAELGETLVASRPGRGRCPDGWITGPERSVLYRLAMGTGFRANEIRTLTPERFQLDGDTPTVTVEACYSKNGKQAVQPITRELAAHLAPFIATRERGKPIMVVPDKTARMLRIDMEAAGIPFKDASGRVLDFHALRHSYITHLHKRGLNPKTIQILARHGSITLTMDRYCHEEDDDVRGALEGKGEKDDVR